MGSSPFHSLTLPRAVTAMHDRHALPQASDLWGQGQMWGPHEHFIRGHEHHLKLAGWVDLDFHPDLKPRATCWVDLGSHSNSGLLEVSLPGEWSWSQLNFGLCG